MINEATARRIIKAFDAFRSGHWRWLEMPHRVAFDAQWIATRYNEIKYSEVGNAMSFADIAGQAKAEFILVVLGAQSDNRLLCPIEEIKTS